MKTLDFAPEFKFADTLKNYFTSKHRVGYRLIIEHYTIPGCSKLLEAQRIIVIRQSKVMGADIFLN